MYDTFESDNLRIAAIHPSAANGDFKSWVNISSDTTLHQSIAWTIVDSSLFFPGIS